MNILITGGSGFIGRSIIPILSREHDIFAPSSSELDLTNFLQVKDYIHSHNFQYIIHCAVNGGRRTAADTLEVFYDNIKMLDNIVYFSNNKRRLITFSSGAEVYTPYTYYGFSKKIGTSLTCNNPNVIRLRLYNVFGELGMADSFIHTAIQKCLKNEDLIIWEDKVFDTYYVKDLARLIKLLLQDHTLVYRGMDCVYEQKYKLSDIANIIKSICKSNSKIIIEKNNGQFYVGHYRSIDRLRTTPLEVSLRNMIKHIENTRC